MKSETQSGDAPQNGDARRFRAFLADESPLMLGLLARVLAEDKRISVVGSATDGRQAFQLALMSRADLVLMDIHMPGLISVECMRWLKQLPNPPIIFVLAWDDSPESRTRSLAAGADAFLVKTEDLAAQLQKAVQNCFDGHANENRPMTVK